MRAGKTRRALWWVTLGLLAVVAAWVASNLPWVDAAPQPVPAALQWAPATVTPERNGFVMLQGLDAPVGADIVAAGLASMQWQPAPVPGRLRWPEHALWRCRPDVEGCAGRMRAQPDELSHVLAGARVLGARCEQAALAEGFVEVQPERPASGPGAQAHWPNLPTPRYAEVSNCVRWFGLQAVAAPDVQGAQAAFARADHLARRALVGARSLIGVQVAISAVQHSWLLAADEGAARGLDRSATASFMAPLLAPLPPAALSPRAWVPHEARFSRETMRDLTDDVRGCHRATGAGGMPPVPWLERQLCRTRLGMLPEQTSQDQDARWLARLAPLPPTGPAPCDALQTPAWRGSATFTPSWRNTLTRWLLDVPGGDWAGYAARQLDLELLRQTLLARATGQPLPGGVQLTPVDGALQFGACRARLAPGEPERSVRLPAG